MSASEDRLQKLIEERLREGSDKEKIDQRIWDLFGEEWCVMFTDLSGFSRNVEKFGIVHFLQTIYEAERLLIPVINDFDGILLKSEGDSLLVIFRNPKKALLASFRMQAVLGKYNLDRLPEEKVLLCLGLGYGRILKIGDADVFGAEVNAASKLGEDTAKAGEILITENLKKKFESMTTSNGNKVNTDILFTEIPDVPSGAKKAYRISSSRLDI